MDELTPTLRVTKRLVISTIAFAIVMLLSTVAFYYFHAKAPLRLRAVPSFSAQYRLAGLAQWLEGLFRFMWMRPPRCRYYISK